jgi:butyrate response factor 1
MMPKSNNPVDSVGMSNQQQQQFYFMPVSTQSSWDYVVPAPISAMKKDVQVIVAPQQKPRPQVDFVNVKTAPNPWGAKSPKKTAQEEEPIEEDGEKGKKNEIEDELTQQSLYKTELCRSWTETGACRYGNKCQFAHGKDEVRQIMRHPKYKTEICKTFHTQGTCPYGTRCRFIHNPSLRASHLQQQQQFPVETVAKSLEPTLPAAVTPPQMIPQPAHSIWSTPLLVPSPVSEVPIESAFGALSLSPTSPASPDDMKFGRLPIFQRFTK